MAISFRIQWWPTEELREKQALFFLDEFFVCLEQTRNLLIRKNKIVESIYQRSQDSPPLTDRTM